MNIFCFKLKLILIKQRLLDVKKTFANFIPNIQDLFQFFDLEFLQIHFGKVNGFLCKDNRVKLNACLINSTILTTFKYASENNVK